MMDDSKYDVVYNENVRVNKPDGSPLLVLLKNILEPEKISQAWSALKRWNPNTDNRSTAAGIKAVGRKKLTGEISKTSRVPAGWGVVSGIFGYFERNVRYPYAHSAAWNLKNPDEYAKTLPLLQQVSSLFEQHVPDRYAVQKSYVERTPQDFVIPGTVFTTITMNKNFRTAAHLDAGDLAAGFSCMSVLKEGVVKGGRLVLPNWRAAVELDHGDVILFDAHEWHGNTQVIPMTPKAVRCSLVHYYREKLVLCKSAAEELELVKKRKPGDPLFPELKHVDSVP